MKWIEEKMKVLGCDTHPGYKLSFYLDSRAMISIQADRYGVIEVSDTLLSCSIHVLIVNQYRIFKFINNLNNCISGKTIRSDMGKVPTIQ